MTRSSISAQTRDTSLFETYARLLAGETAQLVFTDPPYNVKIDGHVSGLGAAKHREFAMASGEMSEGEFTTFLARVFTNLVAASADGAIHFVCMDWRHMGEVMAAARDTFAELKNLCVWSKTNGGVIASMRSMAAPRRDASHRRLALPLTARAGLRVQGRHLFASRCRFTPRAGRARRSERAAHQQRRAWEARPLPHERVLPEASKRRATLAPTRSARPATTTLRCTRPSSRSPWSRTPSSIARRRRASSSTPSPVSWRPCEAWLRHDAMLRMDGTTLVAAHKTRRRVEDALSARCGFGIELDPHYCDVILARLAKATRLEPVLAGSGQTFGQAAAARAAATAPETAEEAAA